MNEKEILNALLRTNFYAFIEKTFNTIVPGEMFHRNWHIEVLSYYLQLCLTGDIKRLIITMPPRSLKSIVTSVAFPAFILGHEPSTRIICASYGQELATKLGNDMRSVMAEPWYQSVFPQTRPKQIGNTQTAFQTTKMGVRYSTSVGGGLTGFGGSIAIIDDPHKADEAISDHKLEQVIAWFQSTLLTRLDDKANGVIIVIQQRLHENDLAGHLLAQGGWTHLNLRAIAEETEKIPIGPGKYHTRVEGDLLDAKLLPKDALDQLKKDMGSYPFAAQYQQRPAPIGGGMVKVKWFKLYKKRPRIEPGDRMVQSWDTATTANDSSNFSVCTTWLVKKNRDCYLLHVYRKKLEYPLLKRQALKLIDKYKPDVILIEASPGGWPLIQELREFPSLKLAVYPIQPIGDKVTRLYTHTSMLENGCVFLDKNAVWLADFLHELSHFPKSKYDDQVDSVSQFLYYVRSRMARHSLPQDVRSRVTSIYSDSHLPDHLFSWE